MITFDYSKVPADVTITAVVDVTLPLPIPNSKIDLKAGDKLVVKANSSMDLIFFDKLAESLGDAVTMAPACRTEA